MKSNLMTEKVEGDGNCFEVAAKMVLQVPNLSLCHGIVTGQGKISGIQYSHAWCELNGMVFDNSNGRSVTMKKQQYYRLGKIKNVKKYSHSQLTDMILKTEHYGPWEDEQA